jgi:hypothetical protein
MGYNGTTFILNFVKFGQLVQKMKGCTHARARARTHTERQHSDLISKKLKQAKRNISV